MHWQLIFQTFKNRRWRAAAILKNRKPVITLHFFDRSALNLARWCTLTFITGSAVKILNLEKLKMADSCNLKKSKNGHNSARFDWSARNLAHWGISALRTRPEFRAFKNPRWQTAATLKNRKTAIYPQWFDRSAWNLPNLHSHSSKTATITLISLHLECYDRPYQRSLAKNHNSLQMWPNKSQF